MELINCCLVTGRYSGKLTNCGESHQLVLARRVKGPDEPESGDSLAVRSSHRVLVSNRKRTSGNHRGETHRLSGEVESHISDISQQPAGETTKEELTGY